VAAFAHQPSGDNAGQQTDACSHQDRFEGGILDVMLCGGSDAFGLVFDFEFGLPGSFLTLMGQILQSLVHALGHLAKRYYAGGRVMSTDLLRQTYQGLLSSGKTLQQQHLGDIQARASTLDAGEVMCKVRGGSSVSRRAPADRGARLNLL